MLCETDINSLEDIHEYSLHQSEWMFGHYTGGSQSIYYIERDK